MALQKTLDFLIQLSINNNKEWFHANKNSYLEAKEEFELFVQDMITKLRKMDKNIEEQRTKDCIFRIYRDVRFSKNKDPYKNNFGAHIAEGGRKTNKAGYYIHIEPDNSFIGGGIYMPQSDVLYAIRKAIYDDPKNYKKLINEASFKKYFPEIYGEKLKTAPKGFPKDFAELELIKNKHYALAHSVKDEFWLQKDPSSKIMEIFKVQYPFNAYLNKHIKASNL